MYNCMYNCKLEKFPRSLHQPSLITPVPLVAPPQVRRWNFMKADWDKFKLLTNKAARTLPPLEGTDLDISYKAFCSMLTNAVKQSVPCGYHKNYIPCWDEECQQLYERHTAAISSERSEDTSNILIKRSDEKHQECWIETVESIDFTHSQPKSMHINHLTGKTASKPDKCPVGANVIASQLLQNGRFTNPDRDFSRQVGKEVAELWKVDSKDVNITTGELVEAFKSMKVGKDPGPDDIHPEFLLHAGDAATKWLCQYNVYLFGKMYNPKKSGARQLSSPSRSLTSPRTNLRATGPSILCGTEG